MKRWLIRIIVVLAGTLFVALNAVAYRHAWLLTHFVVTGSKTKSPEKLTRLEKLWTLARGVEIPKPEVGPVRAEFPQPARTIQFVAGDGTKLEAWDIPAATNEQGVVLLFHGYAVSRSSMLGEARVLHDLGWRTVLVDFRGSGGSDGFVTTLGWTEIMDVAAAVNWARHEWPDARIILYGQSMGGAAALRALATQRVRADGVILESVFDELLTTVGHRYHAMGLPALPFARLLLFWGGRQAGFDALAHNPVEYAKMVDCPLLVLAGEHDPWVRPDEAQRVAAAMRGPTQCHIFRDVLSAWLNQRTGTGK